jgi:predicted transcriptional regulator
VELADAGLRCGNAAAARCPSTPALRSEPDAVTVSSSLPVDLLVEDYFYRYHYKMFPVVDDSKLVGCINTQNLSQVPRQEWNNHTVREITHECSIENTIHPDTDASTILATMNRTHQSRLMVVDGDRLLGVITLKDMLKYLSAKLDLEGDDELQAVTEEIKDEK